MANPVFKITYDVIKIDNEAYRRAVTNYILNKMYDAARAFVRAAIPKVPVDTGMARGTFLNVGRLLNVTIPINIKSVGKLYNNRGQILPKQPESGAALAIKADRALRFQGDTFIFEFNQDVFHYNLNEFFGGHAPTAPWRSYVVGQEAYNRSFASNFIKEFPQIQDYITKETVSM